MCPDVGNCSLPPLSSVNCLRNRSKRSITNPKARSAIPVRAHAKKVLSFAIWVRCHARNIRSSDQISGGLQGGLGGQTSSFFFSFIICVSRPRRFTDEFQGAVKLRLPDFQRISAIAVWARFRNSSGGMSSLCVASAQEWPKGSVTCPYRSPQNMSASGIVTLAPASTA
jgi:hypothetical protein